MVPGVRESDTEGRTMTKAWPETAVADGTSIHGNSWVRKGPRGLKELEEGHHRVVDHYATVGSTPGAPAPPLVCPVNNVPRNEDGRLTGAVRFGRGVGLEGTLRYAQQREYSPQKRGRPTNKGSRVRRRLRPGRNPTDKSAPKRSRLKWYHVCALGPPGIGDSITPQKWGQPAN